MEPKDFQKYASWCNANLIFFYVVPVNNFDVYKIGMTKKNREKIGEELFRKETGKEHPVYEKIRELYKKTFLANNK